MKKIAAYIALFLTIILMVYLTSEDLRAEAASAFARIETDDAVFYADKSLAIPRFTLPKSYYVKVVETGGEITRVVYSGSAQAPSLEGYVKTVCLSFPKDPPADLCPEKTITAVVDEVMFSDPELTRPRSVLTKGATAIYYGEADVSGEKYLYVYATGSVGYVKKNAFEDFTVPLHPVYAAELAAAATSSNEVFSSAPQKDGTISVSKPDPSQVIVIAILIVAVLCVVFLVFKKEDKKASANAFYRDDD